MAWFLSRLEAMCVYLGICLVYLPRNNSPAIRTVSRTGYFLDSFNNRRAISCGTPDFVPHYPLHSLHPPSLLICFAETRSRGGQEDPSRTGSYDRIAMSKNGSTEYVPGPVPHPFNDLFFLEKSNSNCDYTIVLESYG